MRGVLLMLLAIYLPHGEGAGYYAQVSSVLRSLRDADNISHIVPQFVTSGVEYPVCYFSIANENVGALCKVLCKTAGFQLCERSYAVIPYNRKNGDKGFFVTVNCMGNEYNIGQCRWFTIYNSTCHYLLAIKCADCNNSLTIHGDELSVVTLPPYSPCGEESACVWNIYLQKVEKKVTPIEFQSYKNIRANDTSTRKRILALTWVDYQQETHLMKGTDKNFTSKSLKIASDKFVLHYYAENCNTLIAKERVQLVINEKQEPVGYINDDSTSRLVALILPLCVVVAGIATLIVCICYNIRNKARFQEYRLDAVSSYKSLNCLTGMTSPQKTTVEDYLVTPWGKDYKVHEENDEIQLGSVTKYTINRKSSPDHESERKVERSSSFGVKRKLPFTSNRKIKADTAYSFKRQQLSDVPIPRNSNRRHSSLSKQISSETEPVYSCRNSELESVYSCRSSESEKSCFTHYGEAEYACSEAGTFISLNSEPSTPVNIEQYGSVQSL